MTLSHSQVRKFHSNYYHEKLSLKVQRDKILESSMKATKNFSVSDWCGNFEVTFQGEQGILQQEEILNFRFLIQLDCLFLSFQALIGAG